MEDSLGSTLSVANDRPAKAVEGATPCLFVLFPMGDPQAPSSGHGLSDTDIVVVGRGGRGATCFAVRRVGQGMRRLEIRLPDRRVSTDHLVLIKDGQSWRLRDEGSKNGTLVNGERCDRATLADGDVIEIGRTSLLFRLALANAEQPDVAASDLRAPTAELATFLAPLLHSFAALARVAPAPVSILIQGETGTGKEVVARAAHALSRRAGPVVAVNCGALPETLVEAELFGCRKGAFSGATEARLGIVRSAHQGTLFLDEIGDLRRDSQAALLRVLQEREVVPLGTTRPIPVDIRVVAATHQNLDEMVARGQFRSDLLGRLRGFHLELPALRARREDVGILTAAILRRVYPDHSAPITLGAHVGAALLRYAWPHNIRELAHCLETAVRLAGGGEVLLEHLPRLVRAGGEGSRVAASAPEVSAEEELAVLRAELERLLIAHKGSLSAIAREMRRDRVQVRRWLKRFGLDPGTYRG